MRSFLTFAALASFAPLAAAQSSVTLTPTQDTYLMYINPDSNFGLSQDVWFGRGSYWGLGNIRTLVHFNLSSLPSDPLAIKSATFSAWQHSTEAAAGGLDCELHAATASWSESTATWNNQPAYDARVWDTALVGDSFYTGWIDWDATALVREHASGALANEGWLFRMNSEGAGASRLGYFHSSEYGADPSKQLKLTIETYEMLLSASPLIAGQPAALDVAGAVPGHRVYFVRGLMGLGSYPVPQLGVTLELHAPSLIGSDTADGAGHAGISVNVPAGAAGRSVWLQAAASGELSNYLALTVQ